MCNTASARRAERRGDDGRVAGCQPPKPSVDRVLQAHLFGDIFERDNLDWQSRELATVGALAATPGVAPQLRSHMAASMRTGLTVAQLRQVIDLLAARVDAGAGERANEALTQALAAKAKG